VSGFALHEVPGGVARVAGVGRGDDADPHVREFARRFRRWLGW
jgi:hypothetical protein